jgi:choline kinase
MLPQAKLARAVARSKMKAIILAAGQGIRLRPLTDRLPKCLVQINRKPIMQHQLESLDRVGIHSCVIVTGFREEQIRDYFGSKFANVDITYVLNNSFQSTNNIYSLWVAKKYLLDDIILIEGDILFDYLLLKDIVDNPYPNVALVDKFQSDMDGTVVLSKDGFVSSMILKSQQSTDFDYEPALKTVNIYALSHATMHKYLVPTLNKWVACELTDQFYEAVIAQIINQGNLQLAIQHTGLRRWIEIDTIEDACRAEAYMA